MDIQNDSLQFMLKKGQDAVNLGRESFEIFEQYIQSRKNELNVQHRDALEAAIYETKLKMLAVGLKMNDHEKKAVCVQGPTENDVNALTEEVEHLKTIFKAKRMQQEKLAKWLQNHSKEYSKWYAEQQSEIVACLDERDEMITQFENKLFNKQLIDTSITEVMPTRLFGYRNDVPEIQVTSTPTSVTVKTPNKMANFPQIDHLTAPMNSEGYSFESGISMGSAANSPEAERQQQLDLQTAN